MSLDRNAIISLLIILTAAAGCTTKFVVGMPDVPVSTDQVIGGTDQLSIYGYTDRDGKYHSFRGFVRAVPPDSLEFYTPTKSSTFGTQRDEVIRLSMQDVSSISFKSNPALPGFESRPK